MEGRKLKQIITENGYTMASAARKLGMTPQHLNQALSAADVKSGLLEKVYKDLNIGASEVYGGIITLGVPDVSNEIARLKERVEHLEKLLDEKERLIQVLLNK